MTCIANATSKRRLSTKVAAGLAFSTFLVLGTFAGSAYAQQHWDGHRDQRHGQYQGGWVRGPTVYAAPPVVYAQPYYYAPPPVVYGPAIGVYIPGVTIGIQ
jgi:hypothetical protein